MHKQKLFHGVSRVSSLDMASRWGGGRASRWVALVGLVALCLGLGACTLLNPESGQSSAANPQVSRVPGVWPDRTTTGVPQSTELSVYTGDCRVTAPGTVIDAKTVNCDLRIQASGVTITRSVINGVIVVVKPEDGHSLNIADSEIHAGQRMATGLGNGNFTATRVEITGGRRSANCAANCTIEDSLVHQQAGDPKGQAHLSGIRMGQNTTLRFNTIICEGRRTPPASGCSAALTGYGDFAPVVNNLIEGNRFVGGNASFCAFGGSTRQKTFSGGTRDIRFLRNVFVRGETGKCGNLAPIEAFDSGAPGNVWDGNTWDDGEPLSPRN